MSTKPSSTEINALLGKGSEFEGKLVFQGTVRIDGVFRGEIHSKDTLVVGEGGRVEAEVAVGQIVVHGTLNGNVVAPNGIRLSNLARVTGTISTKSLVVEDGALFEGSCRMESQGQRPPTPDKPVK